MAQVERFASRPSANHTASMTNGSSEDLEQISGTGIERTGRADGKSFHGQYFPLFEIKYFEGASDQCG
jgi:hypothetical protein